jgi:hypothetical protein
MVELIAGYIAVGVFCVLVFPLRQLVSDEVSTLKLKTLCEYEGWRYAGFGLLLGLTLVVIWPFGLLVVYEKRR